MKQKPINQWRCMKKLIYALGVLLMLCGVVNAASPWKPIYPKFHDKTICPDTAIVGQVTCLDKPIPGLILVLTNLDTGEYYNDTTDSNGEYYFQVPTGYYQILLGFNGYEIHAKWRCGVIPFYFSSCPE